MITNKFLVEFKEGQVKFETEAHQWGAKLVSASEFYEWTAFLKKTLDESYDNIAARCSKEFPQDNEVFPVAPAKEEIKSPNEPLSSRLHKLIHELLPQKTFSIKYIHSRLEADGVAASKGYIGNLLKKMKCVSKISHGIYIRTKDEK